jgi:hypothetical protein
LDHPLTSIADQFTIEAIRKRIADNAANLWGVRNIASLDPFIRKLAEIYAREVARTAASVNTVGQRLLPGIAATLLPQIRRAARPAHTLLSCRPQEAVFSLHPSTQFMYQRKETDFRTGLFSFFEDYFFSPLDGTTVFNAPVVCMASGFKLSTVSQLLEKKTVANSGTRQHLPPHELWLGIEAPQAWDHMNGLNLYFDFGRQGEQWMSDLLPLCSVYAGDVLIPHRAGFCWNEKEQAAQPHSANASGNIYRFYLQELKQLYHRDFLHLPRLGFQDFNELPLTPEPLIRCFGEAPFELFETPLCWLKIVLPPAYGAAAAILNSLCVSTTALPVVNLIRQSNEYSVDEETELLPVLLNHGEALVSITSVMDAKGASFTEALPSDAALQTYNIVYDRKNHFDNRTMRDYIQYIPELLLDESAAFHILGADFIRSIIQGMKAALEAIENAFDIKQTGDKKLVAYLHFNQPLTVNTFYLTYYTTQHEEANGIHAGALIEQVNTDNFDGISLRLLKSTRGGRKELAENASMRGYQYLLQSCDRLTTPEDIRMFCLFELDGLVKDVRIEKQVISSHHPKQGYIRAVVIRVQLHHQHQLTKAERQSLCRDLLSKIRYRGLPDAHYVLSVD